MTIMKIRGIARYPHLNKPDTKFKEEGEYKTGLIIQADAASGILERLEVMQKAELAEAQKRLKGKKATAVDLPVKPEYDDDGNETGQFVVSTSMRASGISKKTGKPWSRKCPLFDSVGNPVNSHIGGGSEIIIAVEPKEWCNPKGEVGVKLYLEAVQVISARSGASADKFGFGAVEGGYVEPAKSDDDDDDTDDTSGNDDSGEQYEF